MRTAIAFGIAAMMLVSTLPANAGPIEDAASKAAVLNAGGDPAGAIAALDDAVDAIWTAAPLTLRKALFVNAASGYGVYDERADAVFKPGEPILVYVEPIGFAYGKNQVGGSEISLVTDFDLQNPAGESLYSKDDFVAVTLPVRYKNREFQMTLTLNLTGLPEGQYVGKFRVRDKHSDKNVVFDMPFEVKG